MKKSTIIILTIVLVFIHTIIIAYSYKISNENVVTDDYVVVFRGESGESVRSTYLYRKKKGKKTTYRYINTMNTLSGYDRTGWTEKVIKKGTIKKYEDIFEIAEGNGAYSYVKYKDGRIYTIVSFQDMILKKKK